jgi:hypothetical protein
MDEHTGYEYTGDEYTDDEDVPTEDDTLDAMLKTLHDISNKVHLKMNGYQLMELFFEFANAFTDETSGSNILLENCVFEIPIGTIFYRAVTIHKDIIEQFGILEDAVNALNAGISNEKDIKEACGMGGDTTFCNSHPIENMTIRNPSAINNVMAILKTNRVIKVFSFLPIQQIIGLQLKSGQTHDRGFFRECCKSGDFDSFLKTYGFNAVVIMDEVDKYLRMPLILNPTRQIKKPGEWAGLYYEARGENDDELLPLYAKPGQSVAGHERVNTREDTIAYLNEISENDMTERQGYPVSVDEIVIGTVYPEMVIQPYCVDVTELVSFDNFYIINNLKSIKRSFDFIPKINKNSFIKDGQINTSNGKEPCFVLEESLNKRRIKYEERGHNTVVLPYLIDYYTDLQLLTHLYSLFEKATETPDIFVFTRSPSALKPTINVAGNQFNFGVSSSNQKQNTERAKKSQGNTNKFINNNNKKQQIYNKKQPISVHKNKWGENNWGGNKKTRRNQQNRKTKKSKRRRRRSTRK